MRLILTVNAGFNLVNFRAGLIAGLIADGHELVALVPPSDHDDALRAMGMAVEPLAMDARGMNPLADLALIARMRAAFRRLRPDAVLSWTIKTNLYGAMAAAPLGLPVIPNVSGLGTAFLGAGATTRLVEMLYRRAFRRLGAVFFQNGEDRDLFVGRGLVRGDQARLLPGSGVDLARFAPAPLPGSEAGSEPEAGPAFLMVARVLRDKGAAEFAEAARLTRARHPGARFTLLGPMGAANRTAIPRATLDGWLAEGAMEWHDAVADVRPHLARADVVVLPSYREGMPRTLLEAAAMGRPAIATDVPGCRDAVAAGETGLLCAVRDAGDLARAMEEMIAMGPAARAAMGAAARRRAERLFDEARVIDAYRAALAALQTPSR